VELTGCTECKPILINGKELGRTGYNPKVSYYTARLAQPALTLHRTGPLEALTKARTAVKQ
jgi:hypothetical protein